MRVWTFGGSTTEYPWPTWADILIHNAQSLGYQGANWGRCGASNSYIVSRIMECHAKNTLGKDDWVFVCFTPFFRESWYVENKGWHLPGRVPDNTVSDVIGTKKTFYIDPAHYAMRDCSSILSIKLALEALGVNYAFWFDHDMYLPNEKLAKSEQFNFDTVLKTYENLIKPTHKPMQGLVYRKYKFDSYWLYESKPPSPQPEVHPTPKEYSDYVEKNLVPTVEWLSTGLHPETVKFVNEWEIKIRASNSINLTETGWKVPQEGQWG